MLDDFCFHLFERARLRFGFFCLLTFPFRAVCFRLLFYLFLLLLRCLYSIRISVFVAAASQQQYELRLRLNFTFYLLGINRKHKLLVPTFYDSFEKYSCHFNCVHSSTSSSLQLFIWFTLFFSSLGYFFRLWILR